MRMTLGQLLGWIERPTYYFVLVVYLGLTGIEEITHVTWAWLEPVKATLFPAVLLVLFRYFDKMLHHRPEIDFCGSELGSAVSAALENKRVVQNIDLMACTTVKYQMLLKDLGVIIGCLHLMMPSDEALSSSAFLSSDVRSALILEKEMTLDAWMRMKHQGRLTELHVHELPFVPMFHVLMVEGRRAAFGLFKPDLTGQSLQTMDKYIVSSGYGPGMAFLHDLTDLFAILKTPSIAPLRSISASRRNTSPNARW